MKRVAAASTKRAAIYTRKSTSAGLEQDFNSLDAQREACEAYIKSQGWSHAGTYDDGGFTGANVDRPGFQRLLADVDAGKVDVVLVYKVDRLSRSLLDFAKVMDRFNGAGVAFVSITQNFSTADAMGRLTLNMLMSFAEFEREMIAERTRDKIVAARRKGKWTGGTVPIGYYAIEKKLVQNAPEALVVREVFELYERHRSAIEVMRELRARGRKMKQREWTKEGVLRVLKNPLYAGLIACGKEVVAAEHEAIVSREQFERVKVLLDRPALAHPGKNPAYVLRGLLRCGACGAAMTTAGTRDYRYYRCVTRDKEGARACTSKPLPAEAIETYVVERLRSFAADPRHTSDLVSRLRERVASERQRMVVARGALPPRIAALAADAGRMLETLAALTGRARKLAEERFEATAHQQQQLEAELGKVERTLAALDLAEVDAAWVEGALRDFGKLWELMTPLNRARFVGSVVERVTVNEATNTMDVQLALVNPAEVAA